MASVHQQNQTRLVIEAGSVSYGTAASSLPLVDLLRAYFQVEAGDSVRNTTETVTGKLLSLDRTLEAVISPLPWPLDVAVDNESLGAARCGPAPPADARRRQALIA